MIHLPALIQYQFALNLPDPAAIKRVIQAAELIIRLLQHFL
ncbi:hypothetical protein [Deminuibacter soli]|nr:hypothetical protein [Deminuibacter soli]